MDKLPPHKQLLCMDSWMLWKKYTLTVQFIKRLKIEFYGFILPLQWGPSVLLFNQMISTALKAHT